MTIALAIGISLLILGTAGAIIWYNLRRYFAAESSAATEKALKDAAIAEASRIEQARLEALAQAHTKDLIEATAAAKSPTASFEFLRDSFPKSR